MSIPEAIELVCKEMHLPMVQAVFGERGVDAVFQIMRTAKELYSHVEPERVIGRVVIYRVIPANGDVTPPVEPTVDFAGLANIQLQDLTLEVASNGRAYVRSINHDALTELAKSAVIYRNSTGQEEFIAGSERRPVLRLDPSARSQFSIPTFSNLRDALQHYGRDNVRESTCYVLREVWFDQKRLFLKAGRPEDRMRDSLTQFLRNRLGADHDVWPEQNVDESHPVDIRVQPRFANNRLMLIEIKWLGFSAAADGHITARHLNPRAQKGADQLAQYVEDQRQSAPSRVIQAYYVIVDCRRENLTEGQKTISKEDGFYYEGRDLDWDPAHHKIRHDFDPPYRMFARPIC